MSNKVSKKADVTFWIPSRKSNNYILLSRKVDDAFFCKMPFDYLSFYDAEKGIEKKAWNSKDTFSSLVQKTSGGGMIRRNAEESQAKKMNFCSGFPSFFKMRNVPEGVMSESLKNMKNGGYLLLSSRFSSLFFFGSDLRRVEFVFNIPGDLEITDAIVRKNGQLVILSNHGEKDQCIDRWDLITGTMARTRCGLKNYGQQLLIDREKLTRAYVENKTLYFEEFDENFESKFIQVAKGIGEFNLNSAFVYED